MENLYRLCKKSTGEWLQGCVCEDCAKLINSKNADLQADFDNYATYNFEPDEESCSICEELIDRKE